MAVRGSERLRGAFRVSFRTRNRARWSPEISDDEILANLLKLILEREPARKGKEELNVSLKE
jgi:hypothetical protein